MFYLYRTKLNLKLESGISGTEHRKNIYIEHKLEHVKPNTIYE